MCVCVCACMHACMHACVCAGTGASNAYKVLDSYTVKPPKSDHSGDGAFGLCREVGLF